MKSKILGVLATLMALMFVNSGLNKFFNYMPMPEDMPAEVMEAFGHLSALGWLLPLVGIMEVVAGVLIIISRTRALGAVMLTPIMVGILCAHAYMDPPGLIIPAVLAAILTWVIVANKEKYLPMMKA